MKSLPHPTPPAKPNGTNGHTPHNGQALALPRPAPARDLPPFPPVYDLRPASLDRYAPARVIVETPRGDKAETWVGVARVRDAWVDFIPDGPFDAYPSYAKDRGCDGWAGRVSQPREDVEAVSIPAARVWRIEWVNEPDDPFADEPVTSLEFFDDPEQAELAGDLQHAHDFDEEDGRG